MRQILSRARRRAAENKPRFSASPSAAHELARRFERALAARDKTELIALFAPGAILLSDGGGKVPAALNPIHGADHIARFFLGLARKYDASRFALEQRWINGQAGFVVFEHGRPFATYAFDIEGGAITRLYITRNPEKLSRIPAHNARGPGDSC